MAFQKGDLTMLFLRRRRRMILEQSVPVESKYTHPATGARLIFAKINEKPRPASGPYVVGWLGADENKTWFYRNFQTRQESISFFIKQKNFGPPGHNHFRHDPQMNDVYRWEDHFRLQSRELSLPEMKRVVGKLSEIFNMEAPGVSYIPKQKSRTYAEAVLDDNHIIMYRPHLALLLHEFAHLVNDQVNRDKWAWHGPGFVRTYLSILSLFPEIAKDQDLEALAKQDGIKIARTNDIRASRHLQAWIRENYGDKTPNLIPSLT